MIIKRLSIIKQVNSVIQRVSQRAEESSESDSQDEEGSITKKEKAQDKPLSFKRLVKILNLCHVYIPIIHIK